MPPETLPIASPIARLSPRKQELLARHLAARLAAADADAIPRRGAGDGRFPLSFAQQRLWFLDRLRPGNPAYNVSEALRLHGRLDRAALAAALAEVVRRHDVLRASFALADGGPVQVIAPASPTVLPRVDLAALPVVDLAALPVVDLAALPVIDLAALPPGATRAAVPRLAAAAAAAPFALAAGPLHRFRLLACGPGEHVLLLAFHHTVCDAWSMEVLFGELRALYRAFAAGRPSPLPPLPIQYPDFAAWQRERLQGEELERQLAYWRQRLAGAAGLLALPADRPRPRVATGAGDRLELELPPRAAGRLRQLAQAEGATLFMVLLAVFGALLSRCTGQEDLLVGSPIANRNRPEVEHLIGLFVNTLVLRLDLSGAPGLRRLTGRVRETCLGAFSHADVPFERIVDAVQPERNPGRSPLFQVLFALLSTAPAAGAELAGEVTSTQLPVANRSAKFDLELSLQDTAGRLSGVLEYSTDLFDRVTVARLGRQLALLLEGAAADPEAPLAALPWLDAAERHQLAVEWNDTAMEHGWPPLFHRLCERQAALRPDAAAVCGQGLTLSYGELEARANRLARHLLRLGVGPERCVALCLERSPAMVVALLAILKAGGAYVPLDPDQPAARQALVLADSAPLALLTDERCLARLQALGAALPERLVCLEREASRIAAEAASAPAAPPGGGEPESLAYVLYTSGSTGQPKGVGIPHRGVVNLLRAMAARPGLGAGDALPALATLTFDIAGLEVFLPLAVGGRVEVMDRAEAADGRRLAARLEAAAMTAMQATPATWRLLVESGWRGRQGLRALCGGEALARELASALLSRGLELWNLYGPTETTVYSAGLRVAPAPAGSPVGMGRPVANTRLCVVDRRLQLVAPGVAGQLLIGGEGLARGYWGRPALTAERFVPDPFAGAPPGARLYQTGDLVRHFQDGSLEFLGRIDHQVKIRGFRIELGEIEAALAAHPEVREAVVLAREAVGAAAVPGERRLAAYVVPRREAAAPDAGELRAFLGERLPPYMVPVTVTFLRELPRTPQGKLARQELPAPDGARTAQRQELVLPRDGVEQTLANLWEELLDVHPVGVHDNFFDLGGHSVLGVSLMARIERRFGQSLPLSQLVAGATVADLARALRDHAGSDGAGSPLVEIQRGASGRTPLFLIHPAGGQVLRYVTLAKALGREQPVYGLQDPGVYEVGEPHFDVGEMSDLYIAALRRVQPGGAYFLGGWSLGGILAQEMACRLERAGDEVGLLTLLDSNCPASIVDGGGVSDERLLVWFAELLEVSLTSAEVEEQPAEGRFHFVLERCKSAGRLPAAFAAAEGQRILRVLSSEVNALVRHRPSRSRCAMLMLRADETGVEGEDLSLGWLDFTGGGVESVVVPGSAHRTLLDPPHLAVVAGQILDRLPPPPRSPAPLVPPAPPAPPAPPRTVESPAR